jgi:RHS repeat-associated protein
MFFAAPESAAGKASLRWTMFVATIACSSLLMVDAGPAAAQMRTQTLPAQQQEEPAKEPAPTERPDTVSAQVTALSAGVPVEDLSQRTETTRTLANPDGTWTLESFPKAIHAETADGKFVEINTDLREYEGAVSPVASSADLTLSPGEAAGSDGVADLITITGEDSEGADASLTLGWEGALPAPALEAADAVYVGAADAVISGEELPAKPDAIRPATEPTAAPSAEPVSEDAAGADVVVETTKTGFSHNVVLNEAPAEPLELRFPLNLSEGLTAEIVESGVIEVRDAAGELVFFGSKPLMWDAVVHKNSGLNTNTVDVAAELEDTPEGVVLVLRPDHEFLTAAERVYPVTVDPTWSTATTVDTFVQSDNATPQHGSNELRVGTFNGGATVARSYLKFVTDTITNKQILSASLQVNNWWSWSCEARNVYAQRVTGYWDSTKLIWTNQPPVTSTGQLAVSTAKGFSSACPAGDIQIPVTNIIKDWAINPGHNYGIRLVAGAEADNYGWKRFRSNNYASGDHAAEPHLKVTYNSYPNTPTSRAFGSGQAVNYTDPATGAVTTYVKTLKPTMSGLITDPDGGNVRVLADVLDGSTTVWSKVAGSTVASGSRSTITPPSTLANLVDGKTYATKMWGGDLQVYSKASLNYNFTVDVTAPGAPSVTASGVTNGGWVDTKPTKNTFTFSSTATDTVKFQYSQDGKAFVDLAATGTTTKTAKLDWTPDGAHELRVRAVDKAANVSALTTFKFGFGGAALTAPKSGATSTDTFRVVASAPPAGSGTVTPKVYWRAAGTSNNMTTFSATNGSSTDWVLADTLDTLTAGTEAVAVDYKLDGAAVADAMGKKRVPALLDVQVCFTYTSPAATRCTWTQETGKVTVLRLPHAFGNGYPVTEAGPGQAALYTGELNVSDTDVSVDAGGTGLSIGRSYSSLSGAGSSAGAFGPGWRASFHGPDAGLAGFLVADTTGIDGTISLIGEDETAMVFRQPDGTKTAGKIGLYTPVDDEAVASGLKLELTGTGADARITVTEDDGTRTVYVKGKVDDGAQLWDPEKVIGPASVGEISFTRDSAGRIIRILAPTQDNTITCPATGTLNKGCRALDIAYATTTGAGKVAGQIDTISFTAYDPAAGAMKSTVVAVYAYDVDSKRLTTVTNPRNNQTTTYGYGANTSAGVPSLTSIKDSGLAGYTFTYGLGSGKDEPSSRRDWVETIQRGLADGTVNADGTAKTVQVARFVYGVTPSGDGTNLPDLRSTAVQLWDQTRTPVRGAAVFAADKPVTSSNAASITAGDFRYASLQYWDAEGYTTNTANYGAGAWQNSATDYDDSGNVVRSFTAGAIAQIRALAVQDPASVTNGVVGNNNEFATITRYTTNAAGTYPTDVWAPVAPSGPNGDLKRSHTKTVYTPVTDLHPDTDKPRMLALETITTEAAPSEGTTDPQAVTAPGEPVLSHIRNGYDALGSTDKADPTSGWIHGVPTSVTIVMGSGQADIVSRTVLDNKGRAVETRQPKSNGTDAGTTRAYYYTAAEQAAAPQCGKRAEWVGLVCATVPAGPGAVAETTTGYNQFLQPTQTVETGEGGATRTTDTAYLPDSRVDTEKTTVSSLPGSKAVPTTKTLYHDATGIKIGTATLNDNGGEIAKTVSEIDLWGRTTSYTNAGNETTTTTYTVTGQVGGTATVHDGTTYTTTYTYDGTDANGKEERRGLPVAMTVNEHGATGTTGTYTAAYDAAGALTNQGMPGGIIQTRSYDQAGRAEGLAYNGQVTTTAEDGTTSTATGPWIAWTQARNTLGLVTNEATPDGALLTGGTTGDPAAAYHRNYDYDRAGRLTTVQDRTASSGAVINTDPAEGPVTGCTTRAYTFDANGNRTALATSAPASDGNCGTANPATRAWAYDAADRVLTGANNTGAYIYDGLGRQITLPAADTPATDTLAAGAGDITLAYYDTEQSHTITRNEKITEFLLDPEGRRLNAITDGVQETNGYSDSSDNPSWVTTSAGQGPARTRYESVIGGDLGITITGTTAKLALNNPHGDTVTTITLPATGNATGVDSWANYDEYGNKTGTTPDTGLTTYGWHGAAQRALDNSGLILMGARLYNTVTGLFTSRDPIVGGNTTTYTYPQDPINRHDISGKAAPVLWVLAMLARIGIKQLAAWIGKTQIKKAVKSYLLTLSKNKWNHILAPKHKWNTVGAKSKEQVADLMGRAVAEGKHYSNGAHSMIAVWGYNGRTIVVTYAKNGGKVSNGWVK